MQIFVDADACPVVAIVEKVAKMRGMEKIIMSNFSVRSTQIQHKSDFVQFAIYKKKPRNHYGFKVFLGGE